MDYFEFALELLKFENPVLGVLDLWFPNSTLKLI